MKAAICNVGFNRKFALKKDVMAGFGEGAYYGDSIAAKILRMLKMAGITYPPMSFGYIASLLLRQGWQVEVYTNEMPPEADLVLIHSSSTDHYLEIDFARKAKKVLGARVGFIGPMASFVPEPYLEVADFVVTGEPEPAFQDGAQVIGYSGLVNGGANRELFENVFPEWSPFDYRRFSYFPNISQKPVVPVLSSRGCSEKCDFCPYWAHYGHWTARSVESVLSELEYQKLKIGIRGCVFRDPFFTSSVERVSRLCEGILKQGFDLRWSCETRWDRLPRQLIDQIYKAGCRNINLGIESVNQLPPDRRGEYENRLEKARRAVNYAASKGIFMGIFFMIGFPEDTEESIRSLMDYSKTLKAGAAQFFINTPFPGTPQFKRYSDRIYTRDWSKFNGYHATMHLDHLTQQQLYALKEQATVSYFFRPSFVFRLVRRIVKQWLHM